MENKTNQDEYKLVKVPYCSFVELPVKWFTKEPIYNRHNQVKDYQYKLYRDDLSLEIDDKVFLTSILWTAWKQFKQVEPDFTNKFHWSVHSDYDGLYHCSTRFETDGQNSVIRDISAGYTTVKRCKEINMVLNYKTLPLPCQANTPSMNKS